MIRSVSSESSRETSRSSCALGLRAALGLGFCVAFVASAADVRAEGGNASVPDPAAAALFQAGRDLLDRNNWKEGCAKFEASMILYPAASTLLNIARCYEHDGKLALAWSAYQRALVINRETQGEERKKALEEVAQKGLASVEPRLPRIKISVKGGLPEGLRVSHNGKDIPIGMLNTTIPTDPGTQSITADAPGSSPIVRTVEVGEGKLVEVMLDLSAEPTASGGHVPLWAWISSGAGVALLAGSAVFRADQAFIEGKQSGICGGDVEHGCPAKEFYAPTDDNARKNLDNALFIGLGSAGVAALGAGIVGIVLAQGSKPKAASAAMIVPLVGLERVGIGGRF